jgi:DNA-directed RNA polymerase
MASLGVEKFRRESREALANESATEAKSVRFILKHVIEPAALAIAKFREAAKAGAGRRHTLIRLVQDADANVLAYLAARMLLDGMARGAPLTTLALAVGRAVELEQRIAAFSARKETKALARTALKNVNEQTDHEEHRRKVILHLLNTQGDGWAPWSERDQLLVGQKLVELLIEATRIASIGYVRENRKTVAMVQVTATFRDWMTTIDAQLEMLSPEFMPCVIPPKPWTSLRSGGYHTDAFVNPPRLVKTRADGHEALLENADLSLVYRAVNAIQATPWAIEKRTLAVMEEIVERTLDLPVLPAFVDTEVPERPTDLPEQGSGLTEEQQRRLRAWKRTARDVYTHNAKLSSKRLQVLKALSVAREFSQFPALYFPHQLDFRGRVYPIPQGLWPQGPDFAKGLLVFAEGGAPLADERAVGWFMIHGANTYGVDKVSLDERIAWVEENHDAIMATAAAPLDSPFWCDADSPFCFLTWAFEYRDFHLAQAAGADFVSRIPIAMDGTCNGLQHYSAILRDPVGGAAVNLVPSNKPQDIYGEVAKVVVDKLYLTSMAANHPSLSMCSNAAEVVAEADMAATWGSFGIDRSITKRPVMVLPYGGTQSSCHEYVRDAVQAKIAAGEPNRFGDQLGEACTYLAGIVWESIGDVVVAASAAMGWLVGFSRVVSRAGLPLSWVTPSGFPVVQAYPDTKKTKVKTAIHGSVAQLTLVRDVPGTIDKRQQASGIAPNFIHSMDAAALVLTVNLALDNGVTNFAMIHDSYGTSASATDMLAACIRHAFVDMYLENDVLQQFHDRMAGLLPEKAAATLPPVPTAGGLDLNKVLDSQFFFA